MPHSTSPVKRATEWPYRVSRYNGGMRVDKHQSADEQWKRERAAFFDRMEAIAKRANVPEREAQRLVADGIVERRDPRRTQT